jgi:hypothetical protein
MILALGGPAISLRPWPNTSPSSMCSQQDGPSEPRTTSILLLLSTAQSPCRVNTAGADDASLWEGCGLHRQGNTGTRLIGRIGGRAPDRLNWHPVLARVQQGEGAVRRIVPDHGDDRAANFCLAKGGAVPMRQLRRAGDRGGAKILNTQGNFNLAFGPGLNARIGDVLFRPGRACGQGDRQGRAERPDKRARKGSIQTVTGPIGSKGD